MRPAVRAVLGGPSDAIEFPGLSTFTLQGQMASNEPVRGRASPSTARLQALAATPARPTSPPIPHAVHPADRVGPQPEARQKPIDLPLPPPPYRPHRPAYHRKRSPSPVDPSRPLGSEQSRGRSRTPRVLWRSEVPESGEVPARLGHVRKREALEESKVEQDRLREVWSRELDGVGL